MWLLVLIVIEALFENKFLSRFLEFASFRHHSTSRKIHSPGHSSAASMTHSTVRRANRVNSDQGSQVDGTVDAGD